MVNRLIRQILVFLGNVFSRKRVEDVVLEEFNYLFEEYLVEYAYEYVQNNPPAPRWER